jgi:hypothetical protein
LKPLFLNIRLVIVYGLLSVGTLLMLRIILHYYPINNDSGFLQVKQDYVDIPVWKTAFYLHVFTSIFCLTAGFTQFSATVLKKYTSLHRFVGKLYVAAVVFFNVPAGMVLAVYANGHLPTKTAFVILDCLWFYFTLQALLAIKKKNIPQHKNYMILSYALTLSAVTLRAWKLVIANSFDPPPMTLYMIDAWMGFVPNLLFAWWLVSRNKLKITTK